ncbi:HdeD family acid-resistance protein [Aeoliella mucimassa]|uniref:Acid-resistance membrane protein n=1 Tax=Aeoliella mucimassa TaxID=2527972 RepID=A0A518APX5_9BACT|nr:HdeD family acid-resistance protein [Aeoliella mucimassa]QDU56774.1 acid-resistance membrane protein [Aeoliella mucimassa]
MNQELLNEAKALRDSWLWLLILGVVLVLGGVAAIATPLLATVGVVSLLGILMIVAGVAQIVSAFHCRGWEGVLLHLLVGILYSVTGFFVLENPGKGAAGLTLLMAAFFLAAGIIRIVVALKERFPGWGWTLLNGAVTVLLGLIIWRQFPESALWVIGLLVGIDLMMSGWAWIMFALVFRKLPVDDDTPTLPSA